MSAPWLSRTATVGRVKTEIPESVKDAVRGRALGHCESCGMNAIHSMSAFHHRRLRGMGGSTDAATHTVANVVLICNGCHRDVHANPVEARAHGWIVRQGANPARIALLLHDGRTVFLTAHGYDVLPDDEVA